MSMWKSSVRAGMTIMPPPKPSIDPSAPAPTEIPKTRRSNSSGVIANYGFRPVLAPTLQHMTMQALWAVISDADYSANERNEHPGSDRVQLRFGQRQVQS